MTLSSSTQVLLIKGGLVPFFEFSYEHLLQLVNTLLDKEYLTLDLFESLITLTIGFLQLSHLLQVLQLLFIYDFLACASLP